MRSLILSATARFLLPILLMFSLFLLVRGHHMPGGGFVGGLVASAAFMLYAIAYDVQRARQLLRVDTVALLGAGLCLALASGVTGLFLGKPFMTGLWLHRSVPIFGTLGTPAVFDMGVYLVVLGATLTVLFTLAED